MPPPWTWNGSFVVVIAVGRSVRTSVSSSSRRGSKKRRGARQGSVQGLLSTDGGRQRTLVQPSYVSSEDTEYLVVISEARAKFEKVHGSFNAGET